MFLCCSGVVPFYRTGPQKSTGRDMATKHRNTKAQGKQLKTSVGNQQEASISWKQCVHNHLLAHLYADVIPLVLNYAATICFSFLRSIGKEGKGLEDGQFNSPSSICVDGEELFVADTFNARIQVFHQSSGRFLRKWDAIDNTRPYGIAVDQHEIFVTNVHVTEIEIQVYNLLDCRLLRRWNQTDDGKLMSKPMNVFVRHDDVFASDPQDHRIVIFSREGKLKKSIGNFGKEHCQFNYPRKLLIHDEELYIGDVDNYRIQVLNPDSGQYLRHYDLRASADIGFICGFIVHGNNIIICDPVNRRLVSINLANGHLEKVIRNFESKRTTNFTFFHPCDLAINCQNELFLCDGLLHRVLVCQ